MTVDALKESTYLPDQTFPINIFSVKRFSLHWHDHMEWIWIKKGCARVQIDDQFAELRQGDLALVNSKQMHAASPLDGETEMAAIVFNDALMRSGGLDYTEHVYLSPYLDHQAKLPNFLQSGETHAGEMMAALSALIREFAEKKEGYELMVKGELFRIFGLLYRYANLLRKSPPNRSLKTYNLSHLLEYMREHFDQQITVRAAAEMVNLSPNHFCKVFKKVTGKTLVEYLHLLRINEAERLLAAGGLTVTEISQRVGFGSITYFGRVYKRIKNQVPSASKGG